MRRRDGISSDLTAFWVVGRVCGCVGVRVCVCGGGVCVCGWERVGGFGWGGGREGRVVGTGRNCTTSFNVPCKTLGCDSGSDVRWLAWLADYRDD